MDVITQQLKFVLLTVSMIPALALAADWKAAEPRLTTRWTSKVTPETAWREYPRPQMVRDEWSNLNGLTTYDREVVKFDPATLKQCTRRYTEPGRNGT